MYDAVKESKQKYQIFSKITMISIKTFSIVELNGIYTYENCTTTSGVSNTLIVYGDNGSGKTTILKLIYHLLSSESGKGHLTAVASVPFKSIRLLLSDGTLISATRPDQVDGYPVVFSIQRAHGKAVEYSFMPNGVRERFFQERMEEYVRSIGSTKKKAVQKKSPFVLHPAELSESIYFTQSTHEDRHKRYISAITELGITCYLIATDRTVSSDALQDGRNPQLTSGDGDGKDVISRTRARYLRDALNRAARYVNRRIIECSKEGSEDTNQIFLGLISKLAVEGGGPGVNREEPSLAFVIDDIEKVSTNNDRFVQMGILPSIDFSSVTEMLKSPDNTHGTVLLKLVGSYAATVKARHNALESITSTVEEFTRVLNKLLRHKSITFSPAQGFAILGMEGEPLAPDQLSSGEQQLLLMFCYLLASNEQNSIFIIDEPEISLNVKWQRSLLDAMMQISKDAAKQILVATHSIELLAQHSEFVVALEPQMSDKRSQERYGTEKND